MLAQKPYNGLQLRFLRCDRVNLFLSPNDLASSSCPVLGAVDVFPHAEATILNAGRRVIKLYVVFGVHLLHFFPVTCFGLDS